MARSKALICLLSFLVTVPPTLGFGNNLDQNQIRFSCVNWKNNTSSDSLQGFIEVKELKTKVKLRLKSLLSPSKQIYLEKDFEATGTLQGNIFTVTENEAKSSEKTSGFIFRKNMNTSQHKLISDIETVATKHKNGDSTSELTSLRILLEKIPYQSSHLIFRNLDNTDSTYSEVLTMWTCQKIQEEK